MFTYLYTRCSARVFSWAGMLQQQPASSFDVVGRWGGEDWGGGGGQSRQWNESPKTVEELGKEGLGRRWVTGWRGGGCHISLFELSMWSSQRRFGVVLIKAGEQTHSGSIPLLLISQKVLVYLTHTEKENN